MNKFWNTHHQFDATHYLPQTCSAAALAPNVTADTTDSNPGQLFQAGEKETRVSLLVACVGHISTRGSLSLLLFDMLPRVAVADYGLKQ